MIPTPIGGVVILIGAWLLFRPAAEMLVFVLFCSLFAGASALDAVALGHSSIPPNILALGFLILRLCRRDLRTSPSLLKALRLNAWLIVYCVYGAASAFVLPRIFAGRLMVVPMQAANSFRPLEPSSQNITQAFYILGTAFGAVGASAVIAKPNASSLLVKGTLSVAWVHILTGFADAVASAVHINGLFDFLRNGAYAQLDQNISSYHRISGMTPEPSAYAALAILFLIFSTELWLRGVNTLFAGITALALVVMLLAVTSSTGYLFLAGYVAVLGIRMLLFPKALGWAKAAIVLGVCGVSGLLLSLLLVALPKLSDSMRDVLLAMTINKGQSTSGLERAMWARQGWELFVESRGLGVGLGSFRSSSFFTAILGSVGPACFLILGFYLLSVLKPLRRSTYTSTPLEGQAVGAAAAWVPVLALIPAAFAAPSADPGVLFAIFAGCSLALRTTSTNATPPSLIQRRRWSVSGPQPQQAGGS